MLRFAPNAWEVIRMQIVSDRIMALSSATWSARKARVLVRDDNTVAVFTNPSGPPTRTFQIEPPDPRFPNRATFTTTEGEVIRFRAVGSSCGWPLAKCRASTSQLVARW